MYILNHSYKIFANICKKINIILDYFIKNYIMFKLPKLAFEKDALEPYISLETINYHYEKHHKTYLDNLNKLIS